MPKPDDRSDNAEKLQNMIENTEENIAKSLDTLAQTSNPEAKEQIKNKNKRREASVDNLRAEMVDESNNENS